MAAPKQAGKQLKRTVKRKLLDREMTTRELAKLIGHPISTVSKAINHGVFPRVRTKILEALNV